LAVHAPQAWRVRGKRQRRDGALAYRRCRLMGQAAPRAPGGCARREALQSAT